MSTKCPPLCEGGRGGFKTYDLPNSRTLDQHISKLRKLIEKDPQNPEIILTVHGVGYRYDT